MIPVIFDLDGTLIDSLAGITAAANAVLVEEGLPEIGEDLTAGFVGRGERVFVERLVSATGLDPARREHVLSSFVHHYSKVAENTPLMPGVRDMLDVLHTKGTPLGLVTNKPRAPLGTTLEAAGLGKDFAVVLAGDDLPLRKPDPAPLHEAMSRLDAASCIYVGDSDIDGEAARAAGQQFLLFTEGIRTVPVEEIPHTDAFTDFTELPGLIEKLTV